MREIILLSLLCIGIGSNATATETVRNLKGDLILLKGDGTWSVLETIPKSYGIAFSIEKALNYQSEKISDDGFGNKKYEYYFGCQYDVRISNNTEFTVSLIGFFLESTNLMFIDDYASIGPYSWQALLAGEETIWREPRGSGVIGAWHNEEFMEPLKQENIDRILKGYGCESQKGSIYITASSTKPLFLKFEPKSGISDDAAIEFAYTIDEYAPLQKQIR
jgi:hypothetical protein